ncbi:MAG: hypothetical protein ACXAES_16245 [Promethearchaeota archaeon]|jgi:type IV secretory pathway VirB3-like protein
MRKKIKWKKLGYAYRYMFKYMWRTKIIYGGIIIIFAGFLLMLIGELSIILISLALIFEGLVVIFMGYILCRQFQDKYLDGERLWSERAVFNYFYRKDKF